MRFLHHLLNITALSLFLSIWVNSNPAAAQTFITFQQFTTDQGLSENVVFCLFQDKRGFIWAGTHHGLNRYDGYRLKNIMPIMMTVAVFLRIQLNRW